MGHQGPKGRGGIALLFFFKLGTRWGWVVNATPQSLYSQEGGWARGPVWTSAVNLASTGIRFPDRPALASRYTDYITPANW
jgi:hypothetical protein